MRGNTRLRLLAPFILCGLLLACRCTPEWHLGRHQEEAPRITVGFVYLDNKAATVCVSGSFNGWSQQSDCMSRSDDGWSVSVSLLPGRYQYAFVIDGCIWRDDPGAVLAEDDGFGIKNSVLIVE
jgi:hypothetical protein